jgi:hypothetical protein
MEPRLSAAHFEALERFYDVEDDEGLEGGGGTPEWVIRFGTAIQPPPRPQTRRRNPTCGTVTERMKIFNYDETN